jgi:hypothetical protein
MRRRENGLPWNAERMESSREKAARAVRLFGLEVPVETIAGLIGVKRRMVYYYLRGVRAPARVLDR